MADGRYASSYGRGQCGMEIHLNPDDPTRTVSIDSRDPSDVDEHEPAGDLLSIVLHILNVVQHRLGGRERMPCDLRPPARNIACIMGRLTDSFSSLKMARTGAVHWSR